MNFKPANVDAHNSMPIEDKKINLRYHGGIGVATGKYHGYHWGYYGWYNRGY